MEAQAHSVRALLNYLQINTLYLGGHGFGAAVAVTLMRLYPEVTVHRLTFAATNLFTDTQIPFPMRFARWPGFNRLLAMGLAGNRLGFRVLYESAIQNKEDAQWRDFRHHLTRSSITLSRRVFQRNLAHYDTDYAEIQATLPDLTCPTLLLWGDEDPLYTVYVGERTRRAAQCLA